MCRPVRVCTAGPTNKSKPSSNVEKFIIFPYKGGTVHDRRVAPNSNITALDASPNYYQHAEPAFLVLEFLLQNQRFKKTCLSDPESTYFLTCYICKCKSKTHTVKDSTAHSQIEFENDARVINQTVHSKMKIEICTRENNDPVQLQLWKEKDASVKMEHFVWKFKLNHHINYAVSKNFCLWRNSWTILPVSPTLIFTPTIGLLHCKLELFSEKVIERFFCFVDSDAHSKIKDCSDCKREYFFTINYQTILSKVSAHLQSKAVWTFNSPLQVYCLARDMCTFFDLYLHM